MKIYIEYGSHKYWNDLLSTRATNLVRKIIAIVRKQVVFVSCKLCFPNSL